MYGRNCLVVVALLIPSMVAAQPAPVRVEATVIDATTGSPIRGAIITIDGATPLATTDAEGRFAIAEVDPDATLIVMADGFEAALIGVADAAGAEIVLLPVGVAGEVIEVEGEAPPATPGSTRLDRDEVSHIPGAGGDLIAALDALPGVTGNNPQGWAGVTIRGSAPEDSRILVDGFEIPILYHIGLRSIIPTAAIAGLEYLPGGFDVAYGRASSGIVAVTTRGGGDTLAGQAETSVIDGGILGQGPVGKRGNVLVAVRRSVVDLLLPSLIPDDADIQFATVPRYWDAQLRLDRELGERTNASVSMIGTSDIAELIADDEDDPDQRFYAETSFVRLIGDLRHRDGPWTATVAVSPIAQRVKFELGRDIYYRADKLGTTARAELARSWSEKAGLGNLVVRGGAEVDVSRWDLDLATPEYEDEGEPEMEQGPPTTDPTMVFEDAIWVTDLAGWTAASADLSPVIRLTTGLRVDGFVRSRDLAIQPRGELAVAATDRTKLRLVAGAYRRPPEFLNELLDRTLDPESATQTIAGVEHTPADGVKLQGSVYYTDRTRLLTRGDDGGFVNQGRGTTYGAEGLATLRRGGWFGFVSYSLSRSTRRDRPDGEERLFDQDQTHDLNVALSWKYGGWQLGGRFQYTSGTPTTEVLGSFYDSDADRYIPVFGPINGVRMPAHHQVDIRIDRSWHAGPMKLTAFLDVANVYMNAPVLGYSYNFDYSTQTRFEGLPIVPSIGLRGEL